MPINSNAAVTVKFHGITSYDVEHLSNKLNAWLSNNPGLNIINVQYQSSGAHGNVHTALITFYG